MKELYRFRQFLTEGVIKENIDFPELEDEFEGAMDAMVVEPEVYLQDIINASPEEIVSDDYYEVMNAVEQGVYSEDEAVELAKAWAKEKLSTLAEGVTADEIASRVRKLGKEKGIEDEYIEDYIDELDGNFEPDAYENSTDKDLLDDLKSYIDLSEGVIKENMYIDDEEFEMEMGRSKKDSLKKEMMMHVDQLMDGNIDMIDFMNVVEEIMLDVKLAAKDEELNKRLKQNG